MSNTRYDLPALEKNLSTARLLYVTSSRFGADWHSTMHVHACTELFYCLRGIGEFNLAGKVQPVGGDDLIIVNANIEHTESSLINNPLEYIVLGVDGVDFEFHNEADEAFSILNCRDVHEEIVFYLHELLHEVENEPEGWQRVCQNLLEALVVKLMRHTHFSLSITSGRRGNKECAAARRYIDEHYAENITLDFLAEYAHVNKYYLVHSFSKEYGISPINYLIDRRIRESKYMLDNTDHSLSRIAHVLGFSSPSYFSQSFRKLEGVSPMEYRKRQRTAQESRAE